MHKISIVAYRRPEKATNQGDGSGHTTPDPPLLTYLLVLSILPRPMALVHLRLGELQGGGVAGKVHVVVDGDQRLRAAKEDAQGLVVDEPVDLLAQLAQLLRVGLHNGAGHQVLELGHRRTGAEGAAGEVILAMDHRRRVARGEVEPTVY